jgi:uncharacterized membrane protein HdeD (DUF308 family)
VNPLLPGLGLTALMAGLSFLIWGAPAALAAGIFGGIAIGIQVAAHRLSGRPTRAKSPFPAGWLWGTAGRLAGVVAIAVAVAAKRTMFPPLPTALGYLGVLIPLLALELRSSR